MKNQYKSMKINNFQENLIKKGKSMILNEKINNEQ